MGSMDEIKSNLSSNPNLTDEIREKLFDLVSIFHKKIPEVSLARLNDRLKDLKFGKIGKFERRGTYYYDVFKNEIFLMI